MPAHRDWGSKTVKTKIVDWKIACHQPLSPFIPSVHLLGFCCEFHDFNVDITNTGAHQFIWMILDVCTTYDLCLICWNLPFLAKKTGFPAGYPGLALRLGWFRSWSPHDFVVETHRRFLNWAKDWNLRICHQFPAPTKEKTTTATTWGPPTEKSPGRNKSTVAFIDVTCDKIDPQSMMFHWNCERWCAQPLGYWGSLEVTMLGGMGGQSLGYNTETNGIFWICYFEILKGLCFGLAAAIEKKHEIILSHDHNFDLHTSFFVEAPAN